MKKRKRVARKTGKPACRAGRRASEKLMRVSINDLLPVKPSYEIAQIRQQQQQMYQDQIYGLSDSLKRLERISFESAPQNIIEAKDSMDQSLAMIDRSQSLAILHSQDAFEEARQKMGLTKIRSELQTEIFEAISFEKGLKAFRKLAAKHTNQAIDSLSQANDLIPHLTRSEISMFSLIRNAPAALFDGIYSGDKKLNEIQLATLQDRLTMHCGSNVASLVYTNDILSISDIESGIYETDPYEYLGMTGKRENLEHVALHPAIKRSVSTLIPLLTSNRRLHEKLWFSSEEAFMTAFGKLAAVAFVRVFPERADELKVSSIRKLMDGLPRPEAKKMGEEQSRLEKLIYQARIFDLGRKKFLTGQENLQLIGLTTAVPAKLVGEAPFRGYMVPYGLGVKLIDQSGNVCGYLPYNEWYVREAIYQLHHETDDMTRQNRTATELFNDLKSQLDQSIIDQAEAAAESETEFELSPLEEIQMNIWLEYGIKLEISSRERIVEITSLERVTPDDFKCELNIKFNLHEARLIQRLISILPRDMLDGVKNIAKYHVHTPSIDDLVSGTIISGQYQLFNKSIVLYEHAHEEANFMTPAFIMRKGFSLMHEIGESIWAGLSDLQKQNWKEISWPWNGSQAKKDHFLTQYSKTSSSEDFCDHFACYVVHGPEFLGQAEGKPPLAEKYKFIQSIFQEKAGRNTEYPTVFHLTIDQVNQGIDQELHRLTELGAAKFQEEEALKLHQDAREHIAETVVSWEELRENELAESELEDDFN